MGNIAKALQKKGIEINIQHENIVAQDQTVKKNLTKELTKKINKKPQEDQPIKIDSKKLSENYSKDIVFWHDRCGRISEQYRTLKTHLLAYYEDQPFSLVITSASQGEGKSVTCVNLAFAMADSSERKVLMVDCDFRKHGLAQLLGTPDTEGIAEILNGKRKLDEVIFATACSNVSVLHTGFVEKQQAAGFAGTAKLDLIIKQLRKRFDCLIFDTPAVTMLSDASIIGRMAGDALLVVKMNKTRRPLVEEANSRLQGVNVRTVGVVLTGLMTKQGDYLYRSAG